MIAPVSRFVFMEPQQEWYSELIAHHLEEAEVRIADGLAATSRDANGCWVTPTKGPRKLRFRGGQDRLYRFVYCIRNRYAAGSSEVIRHRCNNRRCVHPRHLTIGSRYDNILDDRGFRANGVDFELL